MTQHSEELRITDHHDLKVKYTNELFYSKARACMRHALSNNALFQDNESVISTYFFNEEERYATISLEGKGISLEIITEINPSDTEIFPVALNLLLKSLAESFYLQITNYASEPRTAHYIYDRRTKILQLKANINFEGQVTTLIIQRPTKGYSEDSTPNFIAPLTQRADHFLKEMTKLFSYLNKDARKWLAIENLQTVMINPYTETAHYDASEETLYLSEKLPQHSNDQTIQTWVKYLSWLIESGNSNIDAFLNNNFQLLPEPAPPLVKLYRNDAARHYGNGNGYYRELYLLLRHAVDVNLEIAQTQLAPHSTPTQPFVQGQTRLPHQPQYLHGKLPHTVTEPNASALSTQNSLIALITLIIILLSTFVSYKYFFRNKNPTLATSPKKKKKHLKSAKEENPAKQIGAIFDMEATSRVMELIRNLPADRTDSIKAGTYHKRTLTSIYPNITNSDLAADSTQVKKLLENAQTKMATIDQLLELFCEGYATAAFAVLDKLGFMTLMFPSDKTTEPFQTNIDGGFTYLGNQINKFFSSGKQPPVQKIHSLSNSQHGPSKEAFPLRIDVVLTYLKNQDEAFSSEEISAGKDEMLAFFLMPKFTSAASKDGATTHPTDSQQIKDFLQEMLAQPPESPRSVTFSSLDEPPWTQHLKHARVYMYQHPDSFRSTSGC